MRFAISAVTAICGLFLLGLAFYGQPAMYLQEARDEWNALLDRPNTEQIVDAVPHPGTDAAPPPRSPPPRIERERPSRNDQVASVVSPLPDLAPPAGQQAALASRAALPAPQSEASQVSPPPQPAPRPSATAESQAVPSQLGPSLLANPGPPISATPGQRQPAAESGPPGSEPQKAEPARAVSPKPETAAKPAPQRLASSKPGSAPAPSQSAQARQDAEDAQSVLARLRQLAPSPVPAQPADLPPPPEPRPRSVSSPSLSRLAAARAALGGGRVENARRLLQEAQLQLVFRPIDTPGDDSPAAGRGAADVAHALEALSANDLPLSRRYIDVAVDDLSGNGANSPIQQTERRPYGSTSGYAPAYPPR